MSVDEIISQARDSITVKRVFGEPIEKDQLTIIPVAKVIGGAGGGTGTSPEGNGGEGTGGGFGVAARPAGTYVIRGDDVEWRPSLDLNRVILGAQIVVAAALIAVASIARARAKQ